MAQEGHLGFLDLPDSPIGSKTDLSLPAQDSSRKECVVETSPAHGSLHFIQTRASYCSCTTPSESVRESIHGDDDDDVKNIPVPPGIEIACRSPRLQDFQLPSTANARAPTKSKAEKAEKLAYLNGSIVSIHADSAVAVNRRRKCRDLTFPFSTSLPLHELLPLLSPLERSFFEALDAELERVENFYLDREDEMRSRGRALEDQLSELSTHGISHVSLRRTCLRFCALMSRFMHTAWRSGKCLHLCIWIYQVDILGKGR